MLNGERCPLDDNQARVLADGDELYLSWRPQGTAVPVEAAPRSLGAWREPDARVERFRLT